MCPNCGNNHTGDRASRCSKCKKITCNKCSFTGCSCGSFSVDKHYVIGSKNSMSHLYFDIYERTR